MTLLPYLSKLEQIELQMLNMFSYSVLVSRVQTRLKIQEPVFFTMQMPESAQSDDKNLCYLLSCNTWTGAVKKIKSSLFIDFGGSVSRTV